VLAKANVVPQSAGRRATDRRARRRRDTTDEIVAAAWALARRDGLQGFTLRDLAAEVGMRAPSLYRYFDSKLAIYDAMFADGYRALLDWMAGLPTNGDPHAVIEHGARRYVQFCVAEPVRFQLLFQRTIPGFEPSEASYALALEVMADLRRAFGGLGIDDPAAIDLWTALLGGLTSQQLANDPGGDRWARLVPDAVAMFLRHTTGA
jgi:AcrR family transcriptional regulator